MGYELSDLTISRPGPAGEGSSKPVPRLSPEAQKRLTRQLNINEGFIANTPRSERANAEQAYLDYVRKQRALGRAGLTIAE